MIVRFATVIMLAMLMVGCRSGRWAWVEDEPPPIPVPVVEKCRGGTFNTERRVTDIGVAGRTRTTTLRTDACID